MASSFWKSRWALWAVLPALGIFAVTANAQTPHGNQVVNPGQTLPSYQVEKPITQERTPIPVLSADKEVAEWLVIDNQGEVQMARLADSKVENQAVKQFAQRMIHDHTDFLTKLSPFEMASTAQPAPRTTGASGIQLARPEGPVDAGRATISGTPSTPAAPGTAGTPVRAPDIGSVPTPGSVPNSSTVPTPGGLSVPGTNPAPTASRILPPPPQQPQAVPQAGNQMAMASQNRGGLDFLHVTRRIGAECLDDTRKEFASMKEPEIDKAYIGQQIVAHEEYIATSQVLRQYASPQLQNVIDLGVQTAESHLNMAKDIMRELTESNYSEGRTGGNTNAK